MGEKGFLIWSHKSFIFGVEIHVKNMTLILGMNISTIYIKACMSITSSSSIRKGTIPLSDQVEVEEDTVIQNVPIEKLNFKSDIYGVEAVIFSSTLKVGTE